MYNLILMKADYEPWWKFEDMEEKYTEVRNFNSELSYEEAVVQIISTYKEQFEHYAVKEECYFAFWNEGEMQFCEGCDEDLQLYYGVILSHPVADLSNKLKILKKPKI